jgi:hypothetical protein
MAGAGYPIKQIMPVLTAVDTIGIQRFVFASNRLRDVTAGSALVKRVTSQDFLQSNVAGIENAMVLAAAGGNALLRFAGLEDAQRFAARYSRALLEQAPGLEAAVAHRDYAAGSLAAAIGAIQDNLARAKAGRASQAPLLGLAVTAPCTETRMPASDVMTVSRAPGERPAPVSAAIAARRRVQPPTSQLGTFTDAGGRTWQLEYPLDLDHLGRTFGDTSLLGVIHLDGNGIGAAISAWLQERRGVTDDDRLAADYATLTGELTAVVAAALDAAVNAGRDSLTPVDNGAVIASADLDLRVELYADRDTLYLPLRPVLLGGDDLTLICDGRLALDLAARALTAFRATPAPTLGGKLSACAGVALVGTHFPFSRAYDVAAELCESAKKLVRARGLDECALDWQFVPAGTADDLSALRAGYAAVVGQRANGAQPPAPRLTMRPYLLDPADGEPSWRWLAGEVLDGPDGLRGPRWAATRNKVKRLGELAVRGPAAVGRALAAWQVADPALRLPAGLGDGFREGRTPLLDAVELLDIYLPLGGLPSGTPTAAGGGPA